ncbi:transcriptional regulator, LacI family domain protein [Serratia plymuthica A30]|nr:transcriptional regulator, LacI family domain protein [Serratia plymuthica A30]
MGALEALRQDPLTAIAVVGFDDIDEACAPGWALTSYSQRLDRLIAEALNRLIDERAMPEGEWRQGELRIRASHLKKVLTPS